MLMLNQYLVILNTGRTTTGTTWMSSSWKPNFESDWTGTIHAILFIDFFFRNHSYWRRSEHRKNINRKSKNELIIRFHCVTFTFVFVYLSRNKRGKIKQVFTAEYCIFDMETCPVLFTDFGLKKSCFFLLFEHCFPAFQLCHLVTLVICIMPRTAV
jgi:hypothetical protein